MSNQAKTLGLLRTALNNKDLNSFKMIYLVEYVNIKPLDSLFLTFEAQMLDESIYDFMEEYRIQNNKCDVGFVEGPVVNLKRMIE